MLVKHISFLGECVLEGNIMYSFIKYEHKEVNIYEHSGDSGLLVMITINHISEVEGSDITIAPIVIEFLNNCLRHLKCIKVGSNYYDSEATVTNKRLGLQIWPGYQLGIKKFNDQFAVRIELLNKCTVEETVLDFFHVSCGNNRNRVSSLMNNFKASIIGTVVLTPHNNKLYKIQGVDGSINICSKFIDENGSSISYKDYYEQKWNITNLDPSQPMLSASGPNDGVGTVYLIPQLCTITGFKDIGEKHLVKEFSECGNTNYGPNKIINKYNIFRGKMQCTQKFLKALQSWDFGLGRKLIRIPGRVLPPMDLKCFNQIIPAGHQGNWTDQLNQLRMLETPFVEDWIVLAPSKYFSKVERFVNTLRLIAGRMELYLPDPEIVQINDVSQRSYMKHLDEIVNRNAHFILCVIKSLNGDLYKLINRKLCIETSVPSQLLSLKHVTTNNLSRYIKTAIRINCKFGGVPWSVMDVVSDKDIMVVGLNMYRDSLNKHKYFCAVMVSMNESFTRYFSSVDSICEEDISEFYVLSIANGLRKYKDLNQKSPRGIIVYRDGLEWNESSSDPRISEIILMTEKCNEIFYEDMVPFAYILVRKSDESKFFTHHDPFNYRNPLPGTIVDSYITDHTKFEFFLISHTVKSGTVLPTYYHLLFNSIPHLMVDDLHKLTYLLTHVYFKCSHTIRVPAPCQLAYDLAYFSANTLESTENISLHGYPFFF
ncbi:piwi-like protein Siwi isoform X2 [Myzus persicae]|nr:piwi-like protein Siwi isoform X2 [Myzus persicae]